MTLINSIPSEGTKVFIKDAKGKFLEHIVRGRLKFKRGFEYVKEDESSWQSYQFWLKHMVETQMIYTPGQ